MASVEDRFWAKVTKTDGCWLWDAGCDRQGYGKFQLDGRKVSAHRVAYELMVGPIPLGQELDHRHTCPKNCVNPGHLRPVTSKQNKENFTGLQKNNTSGVRGVTLKPNGRWRGLVMHNKVQHHVGYFGTQEEAEAAVIAKRLELFTHNDADRSAA